MPNTTKHTEWLSLLETSGPFLSVTTLERVFPQGLEAVTAHHRRQLREAYDEWSEAVECNDPQLPELHRAWIDLVLTMLLEYDADSLYTPATWQGTLPSITAPQQHLTFTPDLIIAAPQSREPRLFIKIAPPGTPLASANLNDSWPAPLHERLTLLCRTHDIRLGLITNGAEWQLVNAPTGSTSSTISWHARLWFLEPLTLKAFQSLLGVRRCFGPAGSTLEAMLEESLEHQEEVTDTLGEQVKRAVEVLVQSLDKADNDRGRELLREVKPTDLYEAGLTIMMRLVFILCAEERGLLLAGDPIYDHYYSLSTLRGQLAAEADRHGAELLDRRHDAWARLLALFRALYGGIAHETLRMPALGGSLFDPDRFPFLEGRPANTSWHDTPATPLPIDNRTVLLLLNALQLLEQPGGALLLSYRALDVEQIGHVYEGLLEHTVTRLSEVTLGLQGTRQARSPHLALTQLERARASGTDALIELVANASQRSLAAIRRALEQPVDETLLSQVIGLCGGDTDLVTRLTPFVNLLRSDAWGHPIIYHANSFMVTLGDDRRDTGTHYTPKSFTEKIVATTLEPLVYHGPAEGPPRDQWQLKTPAALLDLKICDPAMGSGAFLVQACRYLGERLVESWLRAEAAGARISVDGDVLSQLGDAEPLPDTLDDRLTTARRLISERCLYGVDINPLAVELAKLSLWLVTLAKGRPFGFLDHNLRSGDSLLGLTHLQQLIQLSMDVAPGSQTQLQLFGQTVAAAVEKAIALRLELRHITIRDIHDVAAQAAKETASRHTLQLVKTVADAFVGQVFALADSKRDLNEALAELTSYLNDAIAGDTAALNQLRNLAISHLSADLPLGEAARRPFHWALEFPEIFSATTQTDTTTPPANTLGFDAFIGNPPFLGGKRISSVYGTLYNSHLSEIHAGANRNTDLVAHFFRRAFNLLRDSGTMGFIAVNTIAEGDTRQGGLEWLAHNGASIYAAWPNEPWPGKAAVVTSRVHIRKGKWQGQCTLSSKPAPHISPFLSDREEWSPQQLKANANIAFQGSIVLGMGFVLTDEQAAVMLAEDERNREVIFPYLNGDDLNSHPEQKPSRWVINFWDWSEERAATYTAPYEWIKKHVYPERLEKSKSKSYRTIMSMWWQHWNVRPGLYKAIGRGNHFIGQEQQADISSIPESIKFPSHVFGLSRVSKYLAIAPLPPDIIWSDSMVVFCSDTMTSFSFLSSLIHEAWSRSYSSHLETRMRYTPTDVFETFPFPEATKDCEKVGSTFHNLRSQIMQADTIGLTKLYNRFHDPADNDPRLLELRELQCQLDHAVAAAYGWDDLPLDHDFHAVPYLPANDRIRYTISEPARIEVLHRLSLLNRQRYQEEVAQGLHGKQKASRKTAVKQPKKAGAAAGLNAEQQHDLFDELNAVKKRIKFASRNTYCGLLLREIIKQSHDRQAHIDEIISAWAILSEPTAIVNALKGRHDAKEWYSNYPDKITAADSLMGTLKNMIDRSEIRVTKNLTVELRDEINVPATITQDVKLALAAINTLHKHEPTEAIERRRSTFAMLEFIKTAKQGRYEYATTA